MSLVDRRYIQGFLTHSAHWCIGHGAEDDSDYLGGGMIYYTLVYVTRPAMAVCLGSGGGFVPRVMMQAQRDVGQGGQVVLIDADMPGPGWGCPDWTSPGSFFRTRFPDVRWYCWTTEVAAKQFADESIGLLHIDADHSRALEDFELYREKVAPGGFMTFHDMNTLRGNVPDALTRARELGWEMLTFPEIGAGIAVARKPR